MEERSSFFRRREGLAFAGLVAAGAAFRAALALPVARLRGESDSVMTGLTAFKVLRGHHPVFYSGVRLGALEAYFHAAVFRVFGISPGALLVAPFLAGVGFVWAYALFAKELLPGRRAAFAAALAAIPLLAVTDVCVRPTGYDVLMFLGAATLAFAARVVGGKTVVLSAWLTGLCAGLGLWNNLLSLTVTVPALIWIGFQSRRRRGGPRAAPRIAAGFLLGALPILAYNVVHPLATFRSTGYPIAPASGIAQIADNGRHFAAYDLVELALGRVSRAGRIAPGANAVLGGALLVELALAAGFCLWRLFPGRGISSPREASPWEDLLPALIVAATAAGNVFSWTGSVRGATVRYALPVALATPILLANLFGRLGARRAGLAAALLAVWPAYTLANARYPALEPERVRALGAEYRLLDFLRREKVAYVVGDYWDVYGINFLSLEKIRAVPAYADEGSYGALLPEEPAPFALVARGPGIVSSWARRAGVSGRVVPFGEALEAYLPAPNPPGPGRPRVVAWSLNRQLLALRAPTGKEPD